MADLHNPLFEDEKEFLERQKLEYERALLGDVQEIKAKTLEVGKYAVIGASVLGGIWLISKAFGGKESNSNNKKALKATSKREARQLGGRARRPLAATPVDTAVADDLGFGGGHSRTGRASGAPNAPGNDGDPFRPTDNTAPNQLTRYQNAGKNRSHSEDHSSDAASIVASTFKAFLQSDTGKMLVAQASAVLVAFVAKKAGEYLPILKNADLTHPNHSNGEPETRDIEFTYHDDDADAPDQPA